jgi:endonuclease/exonuclease/phosphatase family metal-dependent hydrolase
MAGVGAGVLFSMAGAGLPARAAAPPTDLKVMSFNVRTANADDGVNDWDGNRKTLVVQTIRNFSPDLLGIQEDLNRQKNYLDDQLTSYNVVAGKGAQGGSSGEFVSILYKRSRFTQLDAGEFWLSDTPTVAGSETWGGALPRKVTWVELRDNNRPDFTFVFMNTHWDHKSADARQASAALRRSKVRELAPGTPVVITGDFNADQGGDAYRRMTGLDNADSVRDFDDTYREIHPQDSGTVGTAHGFDGKAGDGRIDWILHDHDFTTIDADLDRTSYDGLYPSDHFPITAVIRPVPEPAGLAVIATAALGLLVKRRRTRRER